MRDLHERVALHFAKLVAEVRPDAWHRPTPCSDWDVRALVDHVVRWNTFMPDFLHGQSLTEMDRPFERDVLGEDLAAAIGVDTSLDDEAVAFLYAYARENRPTVRAAGAFGSEEVEVPESADTQTRVLGILGRRA